MTSLSSRLVLLSLLVALHPALATAEPLYEVRVDGKPIALHGFAQGMFGQFEQSGPVDVEIRTHFDTRWVEVRPLSRGIHARIDPNHETVRFRLERPANLTIEFNSDIANVLHLFASAPHRDAPAAGAPGVRRFGPGLHEAGVIELKSGETLYLEAGAWVRGCVRATGVQDVAILGSGVLDGSGLDAMRAAREASGAGPEPGYPGWRFNPIYLHQARGVRIGGITVFDSRTWTVYLRGSRDVHVDGLRILNPSVFYGNDGIDVVSSSDVLIENTFIRTNDDCVVVKNLDDVPVSNIVVRDSVMWNMPTGGNGIEVGFEMRGATARGLRFQNIDLIHVQRGSAISIHNGDSAIVEDVLFEDIRVEDVRRKVIDFCVLYAQYGLDRAPSREERERRMDRGGVWDGAQRFAESERAERARFRGHVRNVRVKNLQVVDGTLPYSIISGFDDEHRVDDVVIENFTYRGRPLRNAEDARLVIHHARDVVVR